VVLDPGGEILGQGGFNKGVVAGPPVGHKKIGWASFAG
jgi:hypothetical protein